jgi:hypothetical protein
MHNNKYYDYIMYYSSIFSNVLKAAPKIRRNDRRKFLAYYRDLREMKDKKSGYKERYRI